MSNIQHLIEMYCRWRGIPEPHSNTEIQKVLSRMKDVGLVTDEDMKDVKK